MTLLLEFFGSALTPMLKNGWALYGPETIFRTSMKLSLSHGPVTFQPPICRSRVEVMTPELITTPHHTGDPPDHLHPSLRMMTSRLLVFKFLSLFEVNELFSMISRDFLLLLLILLQDKNRFKMFPPTDFRSSSV